MKTAHLPLVAILLGAVVVLGQDSKQTEYELSELKNFVHRITTQHLYTGWDEKAFNRSGDFVAVAIVKSIPLGPGKRHSRSLGFQYEHELIRT